MRVILLGFRYSGKSTIGREIAKLNNLNFIDIDLEIEKSQQKNINEIIKKYGWKRFRELELQKYKNHLNDDEIVISCGGGFAVNEYRGQEEQLLLRQEKGLKILFEIDKKTLIARIKTSSQRPNISGENDIIVENTNLYNQRYELYNNLDYDAKIDTSNDNFINAVKENQLFCVVGSPVWHSLSPKIHNTFFEKMENNKEINKNFLYTKIEIKKESFTKITDIIKLFNIRGMSITSPFKQEILKIADTIDEESKKIGAINTILIDKNHKINGYNTDWFGVVEAIKKHCGNNLKIQRIAIFGSGGGAKSAVVGCLKYTQNIAMFNRTKEKNDEFAKQNNIKSLSLQEFNGNNFDIVINATTLGLNNNNAILSESQLNKQIVFDMVYSPLKTQLLKNALLKKCKIIYGTEMLIYQAKKQFEKFCNVKLGKEICEKVLQEIQPKDYKKCVVIRGETAEEIIKNLKKASKYTNFCELRVDYIKKLSKKDINKIAEEILKIKEERQKYNELNYFETIFTCRNIKNGGNFKGNFVKQKNIIHYAVLLNIFEFLDVDINEIEKIKPLLKNDKTDTQIIVSYHNFNTCLSFLKTSKLIEKMLKYSEIVKVAMNIQKEEDIETMKKILEKYTSKSKKIIFAPMCEDKKVRILAYYLGSWTNFICLNETEKTANGQLTLKDMEKMFCKKCSGN